jgi:hypothetical protein
MAGMKSSDDAAKKSAPSATPTPMPGMAQTPTTSPDMTDMKSSGASSQAGQKNDRRDADLTIELMQRGDFPRIHLCCGNR